MARMVAAVIVMIQVGPVSAAAGAAQLAPRTVLGGKVTLLLPVTFEVMGEEMMRFKYPTERRPTLVFTNPDGSVNVAFNHTDYAIRPDEIPAVLDATVRMIRNLYPSAQWYRSELL